MNTIPYSSDNRMKGTVERNNFQGNKIIYTDGEMVYLSKHLFKTCITFFSIFSNYRMVC